MRIVITLDVERDEVKSILTSALVRIVAGEWPGTLILRNIKGDAVGAVTVSKKEKKDNE